MTQATPTIGANKSGIEYRNEDNDGKKALLNHHKGATAPSYAEAGILWLDDAATPWALKLYDGADWITLGEIHAANNTFKPYLGAAQAVTDFTEASIVSAATTDLGALSGNTAQVTGTTAIISFGSSASASRPVYFVRFDAALTLTHNAASLILPGAANIKTAAGDAAVFKYEGSGNWRCLNYARASGLSAFPGIPQNSQSAAYTTVISDAGKHVLHPSADTIARTFTIDSNANVPYPVGTAITFVNQDGAGTLTIAIASDTMRLAGAGTTGSRTLAANGVATAVKLTSTEWIISGTGLT